MLAAGGLLLGALAGAAIGCGIRVVLRNDEEVAAGTPRRISGRNRSRSGGEIHDGGSAQPALPELEAGKTETILKLEPSEVWEQG